jgi:cell division protein FtsQ
MPQQKSRKILIYIFLFLIIGTLNNKNLTKTNFIKLNTITVTGLEEKNNIDLVNKLNFLKFDNLMFLDKSQIADIISSNTLIEKFFVFKKYPSTLNIEIQKTEFLAQTKKENKNFFLGSNGKLTIADNFRSDMPYIFGEFKNKDFFELKKAVDESNFRYNQIKKLFFYKSGRWDIEMNNGLLIKLPRKEVKESLKLLIIFLDDNKKKNIKEVDLRQNKQIIVNG